MPASLPTTGSKPGFKIAPRWLRLALAAMAFLVVGAGALFVACSSEPITQAKLIGEPCTSDSDCGSEPWFSCLSEQPSGYCTKACKNDADCPPEGICAFTNSTGQCVRRCTQTKDCRSPNYYCHPASSDVDTFASHGFCTVLTGGAKPDGSTGGDGAATATDM